MEFVPKSYLIFFVITIKFFKLLLTIDQFKFSLSSLLG
jgi:hypothetical protein